MFRLRLNTFLFSVVMGGCLLALTCSADGHGQSANGSALTTAGAVKPAEEVKKAGKEADPVAQRQQQLADDTARLLLLANELKAEMDKSTKDTLSLTVVKKAEEVEKLAHKVRDEMKKSIGN